MIKNPDTMKNVSVFLSEIKTNSVVLRRFPVPERGALGREDNEKRLKTDYPPLLDYLFKLFKNKNVLDENVEKIPSDINELKKKYRIQYPDEDIRLNYHHCEPKNQDDIKVKLQTTSLI